MRSAVFLLMFAVCLVTRECAGDTKEENSALKPEQQQAAGGSVVTTKAVENAPAPEPDHHGGDDHDAEHQDDQDAPKQDNKDDKEPAAAENPASAPQPPVQPPTSHPKSGQALTQQIQQQQQQQQQQHQQQQQQQRQSQIGTLHGTEDFQRNPGGPKQKGNGAGPISKSEEQARTENAVIPERKEYGDTSKPKPHEPSQPIKEQPPQSSHSSVSGEQKPSTSLTNTEDGTAKDITSPGTATTNREKDQVPAEKPATSIASSKDNATTQIDITTGDKKTYSTQTSIPFTTESAKGESAALATTLPKMPKALQSLDNKDTSIGSSSLFSFNALATLVVMAVAPAF